MRQIILHMRGVSKGPPGSESPWSGTQQLLLEPALFTAGALWVPKEGTASVDWRASWMRCGGGRRSRRWRLPGEGRVPRPRRNHDSSLEGWRAASGRQRASAGPGCRIYLGAQHLEPQGTCGPRDVNQQLSGQWRFFPFPSGLDLGMSGECPSAWSPLVDATGIAGEAALAHPGGCYRNCRPSTCGRHPASQAWSA